MLETERSFWMNENSSICVLSWETDSEIKYLVIKNNKKGPFEMFKRCAKFMEKGKSVGMINIFKVNCSLI